MRITASFVFVLFLCGLSAAQQGRKNDPPTVQRSGSVFGEIMINEVGGNNLGNFTCANLTVNLSKLNGGWKRKAAATGAFAGRRCSYRILNVPAGEPFVAVLTADFPRACDQKTFETSTSFPMELKSREQLRYGFTVTRIQCTLLK